MEYETLILSPRMKNFYICKSCSAVVDNRDVHDNFHQGLARVADDAYYGGMLRPLGGL